MTQEVDDFLAHFGVKGMRWGIRDANPAEGGGVSKSATSSANATKPERHLTPGQKKALKIGAGVAVVAGAATVTVLLAKNGKIPVGKITNYTKIVKNKAVEKASEEALNQVSSRVIKNQPKPTRVDALKMIKQETWDKNVKELMDEINSAHREQTKMMTDDSSKSGLGYNARRDNKHTPEARKPLRDFNSEYRNRRQDWVRNH